MAILGELGMTALGQGLQSINSQRQQDYNEETMALQFGYNSMMQQHIALVLSFWIHERSHLGAGHPFFFGRSVLPWRKSSWTFLPLGRR